MSHHQLIQSLTERLFLAEGRRHEDTIRAINKANREATGAKFDGLMFEGKFYRPVTGRITLAGPGTPRTPLHPSLQREMQAYVDGLKVTAEEKKFVEQTLMNLLKPCQIPEDIRSALPECLVSFVPELAGLPRHSPAAYTIQDNPRALRQYEAILPKMEIYSVTQLLY